MSSGSNDFAGLDQITTGGMRAVYLAEQRQASLPSNASRPGFRLDSLVITIPCHAGSPGVFVAYGNTDVCTLGASVQPMAMVFQRVDGRWKLAAAVNHPDRGWPVLCTGGPPPAAAGRRPRDKWRPSDPRRLLRLAPDRRRQLDPP